jgi:FKBP-type peptidyl-prolyl cis-trans isomerase (trigger factor)
MKWEFLNQEQDYSRMKIEVDWEEIASEYDDIVDRYAKVPVPGFRAGKTPRQLLDKRFQKEITEDLARRCAQRFGREALRQSESKAASPVEVSDMECAKGKPLQFTVRFLAVPDFDVPDLGAIRISEESEDPLGELSHWLLEHISMRLPDELVRTELGIDGIKTAKPGTDEWAAAADRVKLMLILKEIAEREGIEVDASDVETRIKEKASEFGTPAEELRAQLEKGGGKERLHDLLIAENTLGYLLEMYGND